MIAARRRAMAERHPVWQEMTLDAYLTRILPSFADRPLVITDALKLSYADIEQQSARIAAGLAAMGVGHGDRIGLLMANYPITVSLLFGIWRAGAVAVAINTLYKTEELEYVLRESGCRLLIAMAGFGSRRFDRDLDQHLPGWREGRCAALPELKGGRLSLAESTNTAELPRPSRTED